jgi:hypothetical protein
MYDYGPEGAIIAHCGYPDEDYQHNDALSGRSGISCLVHYYPTTLYPH